jgi:hypothetical protein
MLEFSCWATVGDTYVVLLKMLGRIKHTEKIIMHHYCDQPEHLRAIRELYDIYPFTLFNGKEEYFKPIPLLECVFSKIPPDRMPEGYPEVYTTFDNTIDLNYTQFEPFPELVFADISKFHLPPKYVSLLVRAGRKQVKRELSYEFIKEVAEAALPLQLVLIGIDDREFNENDLGHPLNLVNKTTFLEACQIVRYSDTHIARPGCSNLIAMSHKVITICPCMSEDEVNSIKIRTAPEWAPYISIYGKKEKWVKL